MSNLIPIFLFLTFFIIFISIIIRANIIQIKKIRDERNRNNTNFSTQITRRTPTIHEPNPPIERKKIWFCSYCGHENSYDRNKCIQCKAKRD